MLVVANGAYKSGSSWLLAIVKELAPFEEVPVAFRSPFHKEAWIDVPRLKAFLDSGCYVSRDIVSKGHFSRQRDRRLLLTRPNVLVLNIERDLRDALVSHYYHMKRDHKLNWSFAEYYRRLGRYKAKQILAYHATWRESAPNLYLSSYERLKEDFEGELGNIARFLDAPLTPERAEQIRDRTSLKTMQKERGQDHLPEDQRFFRKGIVGDWMNHFDDDMLADLERVTAGRLGPVGSATYHLLFDVRPVLRAAYRRVTRPAVSAARR